MGLDAQRSSNCLGILSRRNFILSAATVSAGLSLGLAAEKSFAGAGQSSGGYFDIHMHLAQPWFGPEHGPITASDALRWMDGHGVVQAAVLPLVSPESFWYPISTDFVLSETRPHRDRLIPFCAIDPRTLSTHLTEKRQVLDMLTATATPERAVSANTNPNCRLTTRSACGFTKPAAN